MSGGLVIKVFVKRIDGAGGVLEIIELDGLSPEAREACLVDVFEQAMARLGYESFVGERGL